MRWWPRLVQIIAHHIDGLGAEAPAPPSLADDKAVFDPRAWVVRVIFFVGSHRADQLARGFDAPDQNVFLGREQFRANTRRIEARPPRRHPGFGKHRHDRLKIVLGQEP